MSLLVIQIPPKPRLRARGHRLGAGVDGVEATPVTEYAHVWSSDGRQVERHGRCTPALMPKADSVLAALTDVDVSWHRLLIPKAPANRLRAALAGMMEELLLDEAERAHHALGPGAKPGEIGMVAVTDGRWLGEQLANLEHANLSVDRVVPIAWPVEPSVGHFTSAAADAGVDDAIHLSWADANGVAVLDLQGGLARALLPVAMPADVRFSATPAAAAAAEAWLGAPVSLLTEPERMLQAATSPWNLRQFELARRHKGSRALRDGWRT
ncbi:MAG: type II secretion system protein GspL, partial [Ideonella sp.]